MEAELQAAHQAALALLEACKKFVVTDGPGVYRGNADQDAEYCSNLEANPNGRAEFASLTAEQCLQRLFFQDIQDLLHALDAARPPIDAARILIRVRSAAVAMGQLSAKSWHHFALEVGTQTTASLFSPQTGNYKAWLQPIFWPSVDANASESRSAQDACIRRALTKRNAARESLASFFKEVNFHSVEANVQLEFEQANAALPHRAKRVYHCPTEELAREVISRLLAKEKYKEIAAVLRTQKRFKEFFGSKTMDEAAKYLEDSVVKRHRQAVRKGTRSEN